MTPRGSIIAATLLTALMFATVVRNRVWDNPVAFWADAHEKSPHKPRPLAGIVWAAMKQNEGFERVMAVEAAAFQKAQSEGRTKEAILHYNLSILQWRATVPAYERALREVRKAAIDHPTYQVFEQQGPLLLKLRRHSEAIASFQRAAELYPAATSWMNLGSAYQQAWIDDPGKGSYIEKARDSYCRAYRLEPSNPWILDNLADAIFYALRAAKPVDSAEVLKEYGLEDRKDYVVGKWLMNSGDYKNAAPMLQLAANQHPEWTIAQFNAGVAWYSAGQPEKSITAYRAALHIDPSLMQAQYNLALALRAAKSPQTQIDGALREAGVVN